MDKIKQFDKEFPNSRGIFEGGDRYNSRRKAIHKLLKQSLIDTHNEAVRESKNSSTPNASTRAISSSPTPSSGPAIAKQRMMTAILWNLVIRMQSILVSLNSPATKCT